MGWNNLTIICSQTTIYICSFTLCAREKTIKIISSPTSNSSTLPSLFLKGFIWSMSIGGERNPPSWFGYQSISHSSWTKCRRQRLRQVPTSGKARKQSTIFSMSISSIFVTLATLKSRESFWRVLGFNWEYLSWYLRWSLFIKPASKEKATWISPAFFHALQNPSARFTMTVRWCLVMPVQSWRWESWLPV